MPRVNRWPEWALSNGHSFTKSQLDRIARIGPVRLGLDQMYTQMQTLPPDSLVRCIPRKLMSVRTRRARCVEPGGLVADVYSLYADLYPMEGAEFEEGEERSGHVGIRPSR
jgi:hypothetical protein